MQRSLDAFEWLVAALRSDGAAQVPHREPKGLDLRHSRTCSGPPQGSIESMESALWSKDLLASGPNLFRPEDLEPISQSFEKLDTFST
ncbi:hypothetical protein AAVH_23539 [Aphelenchoides avenae]|nr:hypothetical protein AAVH_23539 [Aphelenchus avenae]